MNKLNNFMIMEKIFPNRVQCMYIDHCDYIADKIFVENELRVKFGNEYGKDGEKYCYVFCKIKRNDVEKFIDCMKKLENKMLLMGYVDYTEKCNEMMRVFQ